MHRLERLGSQHYRLPSHRAVGQFDGNRRQGRLRVAGRDAASSRRGPGAEESDVGMIGRLAVRRIADRKRASLQVHTCAPEKFDQRPLFGRNVAGNVEFNRQADQPQIARRHGDHTPGLFHGIVSFGPEDDDRAESLACADGQSAIGKFDRRLIARAVVPQFDDVAGLSDRQGCTERREPRVTLAAAVDGQHTRLLSCIRLAGGRSVVVGRRFRLDRETAAFVRFCGKAHRHLNGLTRC